MFAAEDAGSNDVAANDERADLVAQLGWQAQ
jgi:hypothetical protein